VSKGQEFVAKAPITQISLKKLSELLGLSQTVVSRVVNGKADAYRISKETQERVLQAVKQHQYSADAVAKSLRQKRTHTIGVILPEISEGYSTTVLSGIEHELLKDGYFYFVVSHRHRPELLENYLRTMLSRSAEGIIAVDTRIEDELPIPLVSVSGHWRQNGIVNIVLNHREAANQALSHLKELGHSQIAFIKGQEFSSDTHARWNAIVGASKDLNIAIDPDLVVQLRGIEPGLEPGAEATRELLQRRKDFTAIFAFNDVSAIGAISALRESGLDVPGDVSVIGFDDIISAATNQPPLTTIHQPLRAMGEMAASTILDLIRDTSPHPHRRAIVVHPKLIVRKSTACAPQLRHQESRAAEVQRISEERMS
jgi:LacI family transcriptional regulator